MTSWLLAAAATAQGWPAKPLRIVPPFPAGGGTDIAARIVAQKLGEQLGQTVLVDNRAGAGGMIGTDLAAKATPAQLGSHIQAESAKWAKLVAVAKVKADAP